MLAREIMQGDVTTIRSDRPIREMLELVERKDYSGLPVVDADGRAVGLLSHNDVLRALVHLMYSDDIDEEFREGRRRAAAHLLEAQESDSISVSSFLDRPVRDIMTPNVISCREDAPLTEVCDRVVSRHVNRVVVLDEAGGVVGLISAPDIVESFGEHLRQ